MGGWTNPWAKSESRSALEDPYGNPVTPSSNVKSRNLLSSVVSEDQIPSPKDGRRTLDEMPQAPNDGILEFVTYDSILDMPFENANRLGQAQGPIELKFTDPLPG